MINRYIKCLIAGTVFLTATACNKTLDILPTDTIVANVAIQTMSDLDQAVAGVYGTLGNTNVQYRTVGNADIILSSLMSDENYLPAENVSGNGVNMYKWLLHPDEQNTWANWGSSLTPTNPVIFTGSNYAVIDRANRVLRVIDAVPTTTNEELIRKARQKAELLTIRAFCHFRVLKSYAENYEPQSLGIPYMESINDAPGAVKPSRLTVGESFEKIESDLEAARSIYPSGTVTDVTRLSKLAVYALKARVFLYEKKWDSAAVAATEVINTIPLATRAQFPGIWTDANNSEVIWKLKKDVDNDRIGSFYRTSAGIVEYAASPKLVNLFDQAADIRFASYIKIDNTRGNNKSPYLVNKYAYNTTNVGLADLKLIRVAEMYLIRAEAYAESSNAPGGLALANSDLNALRSARIENYVPTSYNKENLIDEIYQERFKELAFEGHRYFDLRRRSKEINRTPLAADDAGGSKTILKPTDKEYYLPIPGFELRANENMVQNPLYR
ncbi:RagB/SusD family nutrient uptake outer membrane protein [Desertivirga arenae]|uniref:RagB/SusD family nutrient uptake outer membrane protein n=1 Tax=Desertivirga arenae TaxID=2810309 RepID=UPI001A97C723|nr:RagB/SusD family nutrient uptake outer membrane protein [Pedobacter sp. SYSU D00823]